MSEYRVETAPFESPRYEQALALREQLLRKPLGLVMIEDDRAGDANRTHLVAMDDDKVIGGVSHYMDGPTVLRIKQMVVDPGYQGKGIGALLMQHAEAHGFQEGVDKVMLHARLNAQVFYEKLGYSTVGDEFLEKTIPHIRMEKSLR
jgi:GNAT superfamily N-acetyltransferase